MEDTEREGNVVDDVPGEVTEGTGMMFNVHKNDKKK